jgi:hypothetical protein
MRSLFIFITVCLIILGFFFPLAWAGALLSGALAVISAPSGLRPDGKRKTGGLLGGLWDNTVVSFKMQDCPHCKTKIAIDATKCPYCREWVNG